MTTPRVLHVCVDLVTVREKGGKRDRGRERERESVREGVREGERKRERERNKGCQSLYDDQSKHQKNWPECKDSMHMYMLVHEVWFDGHTHLPSETQHHYDNLPVSPNTKVLTD